MRRYLCSVESERVLRLRVGQKAHIDTLEYGHTMNLFGTAVSLYPAGHIIGSSQIRIERDGEVVVISGDYKTAPDRTCTPYEPVKCHTFVTESTFGLPIYRWPTDESLFREINDWWRSNQRKGMASVLLGYSLGKTQRALSGLDPSIGPILTHEAVRSYTEAYRLGGVELPPTLDLEDAPSDFKWSNAMILATPNATSASWISCLGEFSAAFMSGWMAVRTTRGRNSIDHGFVLSDHVDWPSLLDAVAATEAERVYVTHGYTRQVVRYLSEQGLDAKELPTYKSSTEEASPELQFL